MSRKLDSSRLHAAYGEFPGIYSPHPDCGKITARMLLKTVSVTKP
jgi:hypothetical protein